MIIKVCGMRDADNIRQVDELGTVDWMGFIFYPPSSRHVSEVPGYLPKHCSSMPHQKKYSNDKRHSALTSSSCTVMRHPTSARHFPTI